MSWNATYRRDTNHSELSFFFFGFLSACVKMKTNPYKCNIPSCFDCSDRPWWDPWLGAWRKTGWNSSDPTCPQTWVTLSRCHSVTRTANFYLSHHSLFIFLLKSKTGVDVFGWMLDTIQDRLLLIKWLHVLYQVFRGHSTIMDHWGLQRTWLCSQKVQDVFLWSLNLLRPQWDKIKILSFWPGILPKNIIPILNQFGQLVLKKPQRQNQWTLKNYVEWKRDLFLLL